MEGKIFLWDREGKPVRQLTGHADSIYGLEFSPDGKLLASASYDKLLKLWDVASGKEQRTLKHHTGAVFDAAFSPDGKTLLSASADTTVKIWDAHSGERLVTLTDGTKGMNTVRWRGDGKEFAAGGADKTLRVWTWDGKTAQLRASTFAHDGPILAVRYSRDGKSLFTTSEDRTVKGWSGELMERLVYEAQQDWPLCLVTLPDRKSLGVGYFDGGVRFLSTEKRELLRTWLVEEKPVVASANATTVKPAAAPKPPKPVRPVLSGISPNTLVRGRKVTVTLTGQNLWGADQVFVHPGFAHRLLPGVEKEPNQIRCEIDVPANAGLDTGAVRLHTPLGSTEQVSFLVMPHEEVSEQEPNETLSVSKATPLPKTLAGTIAAPGDKDIWSFEATAGQELVFEWNGATLGSQLDAKLSVLSPEGKVLAESERGVLRRNVVVGLKAEQAGKYGLQIEDRNFAGGGSHFYRIYAGSFPYVTRVFPTAIGPGGGTIGIGGFNLGGMQEFAPSEKNPGTHAETLKTSAGPTLRPVTYLVTENAAVVEREGNDTAASAQPVPVPCVVHGAIAGGKRADEDLFAFEAKQGERWEIEVRSRRDLGSALDSEVAVLTAAGEPIVRHVVRAVAETSTVLRDHDSRTPGIRIQNWNEMTVNDYLQFGTEIVRIRFLPKGPDDDIKFYTTGGGRQGYFGTTPQGHALNSPGYKVEIHPPGATFASNGMPLSRVYFENDDESPGSQGDSALNFVAPGTGKYVLRIRDVRRAQGENFAYRLFVRKPRVGMRLSISPANPNIPAGGNLPVTVSVDRDEGFDGPVKVELKGLPAGVTATAAEIEAGADSAVLILSAAEGTKIPLEQSRGVECWGTARAGREELKVKAGGPFGVNQVSITSPGEVALDVGPKSAEIRVGEETAFTASVRRLNGFEGRVPLEVINLPHGLLVTDVGLNGVLITEEQTSRTFVIRCEKWVTPGEKLIYVRSKNEEIASGVFRIMVRDAKPATVTSAQPGG